MPRKQGSTDAQRTFLRLWIDHPEGPPAKDWPAPVYFARWLKNPRFRRTLNAIRDTHRYRSDLHLANASSSAAQTLDALAKAPDPADPDPAVGTGVLLGGGDEASALEDGSSERG